MASPRTPLDRIRNIAIIAHIDHGKTTLSDRLLEVTGAVSSRDMKEQFLDSMDIERERGITIKLQSVRLNWRDHVVNLIDTPGHVDFGYEVSRSLAACEGVVLLVDASQGIEAQTLANCYQALEHDLEIIAVLNKIDLPAAEPDRVAEEIENVLGLPAEDILHVSGKTGEGVPELLDAIIEQIPPPVGDADAPLQALIFDSHYDTYRGVVVVGAGHGRHPAHRREAAVHAGPRHPRRRRDRRAAPGADAGRRARPGRDRLPHRRHQGRGRGPLRRDGHHRVATAPTRRCRATRTPSPWCSAGLYPVDGDEYADLRDSLEKLRLNDGSFTYEPETSMALGFGFRCGFLGMLHMEIVRERLEREFDLNLIITAPVGGLRGRHHDRGADRGLDNPSALPEPTEIDWIEEPIFSISILTPADYLGTLIELCQTRRGEHDQMEYLSPERVELIYQLPLAEVVRDFFDQLKSRTQGYASLDYELVGYERAEPREGRRPAERRRRPTRSPSIVHRDKAYDYGSRMAEKLKELIPRQMFDVPIQAAIGGKIIARETVKAKRKDVLGQVLRR